MARLTYEQYADLLNDLYTQVTGIESGSALSFGDYVSVFATDTAAHQDNLYGILDTMIQRDIYAVRPYSRKLKRLEWAAQKYGDMVRKLTPCNVDDIDNEEWSIPEELAKEHPDFSASTAPVIQDFLAMTINGGNTFARKWTIYRNQMNAAFRSEQGVADFFNMLITERQNRHELDFDSEKMALIDNYILALYAESRVVHVLTMYINETGADVDATSVMAPENFRAFVIWFSAKLEYMRDLFERKTTLFQIPITGKSITRFTPRSKQRVYLHSQFASYIQANKAAIYNPDRLQDIGDFDTLPYWQSPEDPYTVNGTCKHIDNGGATVTADATEVGGIIGFIQDVDAMGISNIDMWSAPEVYNPRFGYQNTWYHDTFRHITDFTEKGVLLLMD